MLRLIFVSLSLVRKVFLINYQAKNFKFGSQLKLPDKIKKLTLMMWSYIIIICLGG